MRTTSARTTCEECGVPLPEVRGSARRRCDDPACHRASRVRRNRATLAARHGVAPGCCIRCGERIPEVPGTVPKFCAGCNRQTNGAPRAKRSAPVEVIRTQRDCIGCGNAFIRRQGLSQGALYCGDACERRSRRLDQVAAVHAGIIELRLARARSAMALAQFRAAVLEYQRGPLASPRPQHADAWAGYVSSAGWSP